MPAGRSGVARRAWESAARQLRDPLQIGGGDAKDARASSAKALADECPRLGPERCSMRWSGTASKEPSANGEAAAQVARITPGPWRRCRTFTHAPWAGCRSRGSAA